MNRVMSASVAIVWRCRRRRTGVVAPIPGVVRPLEAGTRSVFAHAEAGPKNQGRSYAARDRRLACQSAGKMSKIRAGSEFIRRISAMFIFSIRTVVLAVAVSASSLSGAATLSAQSELLCSPEGLMRLIPQFNVKWEIHNS